jgi:XTP/dITP diphosphohydrolase
MAASADASSKLLVDLRCLGVEASVVLRYARHNRDVLFLGKDGCEPLAVEPDSDKLEHTNVPSHIEIRFVSNNKYKIAEAKKILGDRSISVRESNLKIEELQTTDRRRLVNDKLLKAYREIGRPLFVEHTGLYLAYLGGLPGGLTQIFWDTLQADRFAELFGKSPNNDAVARTSIGYCDGRKVYEFEGEISGQITAAPQGPRDFQWDSVFQPAGHSETFAEMGDKKNDISMRRIALEKLAVHLTKDSSR